MKRNSIVSILFLVIVLAAACKKAADLLADHRWNVSVTNGSQLIFKNVELAFNNHSFGFGAFPPSSPTGAGLPGAMPNHVDLIVTGDDHSQHTMHLAFAAPQPRGHSKSSTIYVIIKSADTAITSEHDPRFPDSYDEYGIPPRSGAGK